eukprot:TRINITY_DN5968_c0_g2_i10.p1 TRINITY_DN5968_c0_g2~~TRINITY_DN5968_c0_g2_i10.p1  ORF type:complete len:291 (-),score=96.57 TRINITY_DN5968_c0_g2_i10:109-981(-)
MQMMAEDIQESVASTSPFSFSIPPSILLTPLVPVSSPISNNNDEGGRVLRSKEKRKTSTYLTNSVTYLDDAYNSAEWQFNSHPSNPSNPNSNASSPSMGPPSVVKKRVRGNNKEEKVVEEKAQKKRGRKAKASNSLKGNAKQGSNKHSTGLSPPSTPPYAVSSPVQSDSDDVFTLVIDDPDSTYPDFDHEEEMRRKARRVQQLPPSPFLTSAISTPIENAAEPGLADDSGEETTTTTNNNNNNSNNSSTSNNNNNEDDNNVPSSGKKKKRHASAKEVKKYTPVLCVDTTA